MRNWDRVSVIALCVAAAFATGVLIVSLSIRTRDLEQLHRQDDALIMEGQDAHDALCSLKQGYIDRQDIFQEFLDSRLYTGAGERLLVKGLVASFHTTLFSLRGLECPAKG